MGLHGINIRLPWDYYENIMGLPWDYQRITMGFSLDYHGIEVLLYLKKAPWSLSSSWSIVFNISETHVCVVILALGPPMSVCTHPGCIAITRIPLSLRSIDMLFMHWFRAVFEAL